MVDPVLGGTFLKTLWGRRWYTILPEFFLGDDERWHSLGPTSQNYCLNIWCLDNPGKPTVQPARHEKKTKKTLDIAKDKQRPTNITIFLSCNFLQNHMSLMFFCLEKATTQSPVNHQTECTPHTTAVSIPSPILGASLYFIATFLEWHMGVSKNRGTPKWMVYNGKPYQNGWFEGPTPIFGNTIFC